MGWGEERGGNGVGEREWSVEEGDRGNGVWTKGKREWSVDGGGMEGGEIGRSRSVDGDMSVDGERGRLECGWRKREIGVWMRLECGRRKREINWSVDGERAIGVRMEKEGDRSVDGERGRLECRWRKREIGVWMGKEGDWSVDGERGRLECGWRLECGRRKREIGVWTEKEGRGNGVWGDACEGERRRVN
jgi:hypothetical protein